MRKEVMNLKMGKQRNMGIVKKCKCVIFKSQKNYKIYIEAYISKNKCIATNFKIDYLPMSKVYVLLCSLNYFP